jgi:hypothetical protein
LFCCIEILIYPVQRSIIIDYLERSIEEDQAVSYVFCNYKDPDIQSAESVLASLLQQLCQNCPFVSKGLASLYRFHLRRQTRPGLSKWLGRLRSELELYSRVFIIVDAFDELGEADGARDDLLVELKGLPPNVHLLLTSRPLPSLECDIQDEARAKILTRDEDIKSYLEARITRENRLLRQVRADPTLREAIISSVVSAAKGM